MGNESSTVVDENTPPSVLQARTVEAVAKYVKEKQVRRVVVMVCLVIPTCPSPALITKAGDECV